VPHSSEPLGWAAVASGAAWGQHAQLRPPTPSAAVCCGPRRDRARVQTRIDRKQESSKIEGLGPLPLELARFIGPNFLSYSFFLACLLLASL